MTRDLTVRSRIRGALLGLAAGDAVGTTVEFQPPCSFEPVTDMVGGGPFDLEPGEWTDDTSMALCLAESLVETGGFDLDDQIRRYIRWRDEGHLASNGRCFDIGVTISGALQRYIETGDPRAGSTDPRSAGNGSIMRLAPVPCAFHAEPARAIHLAAESSRTTHQAATCLDACRYLAALLVGAIQGRPKHELLAPHFTPVPGLWDRDPLVPEIDAIAAGSFRTRKPLDIRGSGYVVESLEAALWALDGAATFEEAVLRAVNLGDDADTTAAVTGQLAGALWGEDAIPIRWRERLALRETIERLADGLSEMESPTA